MNDFTYKVSSTCGRRDPGFDRVLIHSPAPIEPSDVSLKINGVSVQPKSVMAMEDSLTVDLPDLVQAHRVTIRQGTIKKGRTTFVVQEDALIAGKDTLTLYGTPVTIRGSTVTLSATRITVQEGTVTVGDSTLLSGTLTLTGDSLTVHNDSVEIAFRCRMEEDGKLFHAFVGSSNQPELWQKVDPAPEKRSATTVFLPSLAATSDLIGNLSITPGVLTPNGDRINDSAIIRFSVFKVSGETLPVVQIYSLRGEMIKELEATRVENPDHPAWRADWNGSDASDELVPPGLYLCRIEVHADSGNKAIHRTIVVAY